MIRSSGGIWVALVAIALGPDCVGAQVRGMDLVALMMGGQLTKTEGTQRLNWLPGGLGYLETETDAESGSTVFYRVDPRQRERSKLFSDGEVRRLVAEYNRVAQRDGTGLPFLSFTFEDGTNSIAFAVGDEQFVYDRKANTLRKLLVPQVEAPTASGAPSRTLSPNRDYFAVAREHDNLFLFDTRTGEEVRLTRGTSEDNLIGFLGAGPWYVWSPDSKRIAYLAADQSGMYRYPILHELTLKSDIEFLRYPFTSDPDPPLALHVVDVTTKRTGQMAVGSAEAPYIRDITWLGDGSEVTFQLVNQWQSRAELKTANPVTGKIRTILIEEVDSFLDPPTNFHLLADGKHFIWSSERSGWRHLYLYDLQGNLVRPLTTGNDWEVGEIVSIDEAGGWVYFVGHTQYGLDRHLFRVRLDGTGLTRLTRADGMHSVSLDPAAKYFTDSHSSLSRPRAVDLHASDGSFIRKLASTDVSAVEMHGLVAPEIVPFKTADGQDSHGILYKPADFDPAKRYPVIVYVYGGPHTKGVRNVYQTAGQNAAFAQLGFLMAEFDGRGTRLRGKAFQAGNYLRLGTVDVDDQAAAVRQLAERPYVDGARVGVTGISHGGYMTLMMLLRYPDVYHVGAAGAPLTDLANGPKQYIGRFMRTPEANAEGYATANTLNYADRLQGRLLLYHGTNDRNAVLANTMQLVRKFIEANKRIDMMIYPEGVHVLEGQDGIHSMRTVLGYFVEHLKPENWKQTLEALWK